MVRRQPERLRGRAMALGVVALLGLAYGLLWNRFWVPGSDGDFYLAIARNLVQGRGLVFNGRALTISPPGWPWALAGLLKIAPIFGFLKSVVMLCMIGFFGLMYAVLRRFAAPGPAAGIILLCAINSNAYPMTFWLHSDALFCLLSAATILLALQMSEGRSWAWRLPVLLTLCIAATLVRWAGLCNAMLIAGALFPARGPPQARRLVTASLACLLLAAATVVIVRDVELSIRRASEPQYATTLLPAANKGWRHDFGARVVAVGRWESNLFWEPLRLGQSIPWIGYLALALGWLTTICFILGTIGILRSGGSGIFWGVAAYVLGVEFVWPHIEARYLVPLLPLILLAVVRGLAALAAVASRWLGMFRALPGIFVLSVALCNLTTYAAEVAVARSADFYGRYEAGMSRSLIDAGAYLSRQSLAPRQIVVSLMYENLGLRRQNVYGMRVTVLLSGKEVAMLGAESSAGIVDDPPGGILLDYLRVNGIRYYLCQEPTLPWRVGHFRLPGWLQSLVSGAKSMPAKESGRWQLWEVQGDSLQRIELPHVEGWPDRVPGL
jgi:hypothetical protein